MPYTSRRSMAIVYTRSIDFSTVFFHSCIQFCQIFIKHSQLSCFLLFQLFTCHRKISSFHTSTPTIFPTNWQRLLPEIARRLFDYCESMVEEVRTEKALGSRSGFRGPTSLFYGCARRRKNPAPAMLMTCFCVLSRPTAPRSPPLPRRRAPARPPAGFHRRFAAESPPLCFAGSMQAAPWAPVSPPGQALA